MSVDYRSVIVGLLALAVFVHGGIRQLYLAKNVDTLEREGKIPTDMAARIRKKAMKLIGWGLICAGTAFFVQSLFTRLP
jgi:hypothetical protein